MTKKRGSAKVLLQHVPGNVSRTDIEKLCSSFGKVIKIEESPEEATVGVIFDSPSAADEARVNLDGQEFHGAFLAAEIGSASVQRRRSTGNAGYVMSGPRYPPAPRNGSNSELPLRMLIPTELVGAVIGRGGATIRQITSASRARVDVRRKDATSSYMAPEKLVTIYGSPESCTTACKEILIVLQAEANTAGRQEAPLKLLVGNQFCGRIIGKGGKALDTIMKETSTNVSISSQLLSGGYPDVSGYGSDRVVSICGDVEGMSAAQNLISAKVIDAHQKDCVKAMVGGYAPMHPAPGSYHEPFPMDPANGAMPHFMPPFQPGVQQPVETTYLIVPANAVGAIIGTKGTRIRDVIKRSGAQVKIETKENDTSPQRRVTIMGPPASQWHAQCMLSACLVPGYTTHEEPAMHTQILVPKGLMGRVIGKQHCNLRDIKGICGASIRIPEEEQQGEEVPISIIANFRANQYAQRRIRSLLTSSLPSRGQEYSNGPRTARNAQRAPDSE